MKAKRNAGRGESEPGGFAREIIARRLGSFAPHGPARGPRTKRDRLPQFSANLVTLKSILGLSLAVCFLAGCAATPHLAGTNSSAAGPSAAFVAVNSVPTRNDEGYESVYVAPQTGTLLGGGYVRVASEAKGNDDDALLGAINRLNAAAGSKGERTLANTSISRATGVSERVLQAQQDLLCLQFGRLCAINAIAHGDSNKVRQIASLKAKGKTGTELATSNRDSVSSVAQTTSNANTLTVTPNSNAAEHFHAGADKLKSLGIHPR